MKNTEIVITGMGVVSAIGQSVSENLTNLLAQKSGIEPIEFIETVHKDDF